MTLRAGERSTVEPGVQRLPWGDKHILVLHTESGDVFVASAPTRAGLEDLRDDFIGARIVASADIRRADTIDLTPEVMQAQLVLYHALHAHPALTEKYAPIRAAVFCPYCPQDQP